MHSGAVHLGHDALVAPSAGRVDRVERRDVANIVPVRKLDPKGQGQTGRAQGEGDDQRSAGPSGLVAEKEVVVRLDDLATILARQVERTTAVEVVDQVDASRR